MPSIIWLLTRRSVPTKGEVAFLTPNDQPSMVDMVATVSKQALVITQRGVTVTAGVAAAINKQSLAISQKTVTVKTGVLAPVGKQAFAITQKSVVGAAGAVTAVGKQTLSMTQQPVGVSVIRDRDAGAPRAGLL